MISKLSKITSLTTKYIQFQRINQNTIKRLFCNKNNENDKSGDTYKNKFFNSQNSQQQNNINFNEKIKEYRDSFTNIFKNGSVNKQQEQKDQKLNTEKQGISQEKIQQEEKVKDQQQEVNENKQEETINQEPIKQSSFREKLKEKSPKVSKVLEFGIHAWDLTFPNDKYKKKFIQNKERAKKLKEEELLKKEYTEEEIAEMEKNVPEWKKGQMQLKEEQQKKKSIREKLSENVKEKVNGTQRMQDFYKSDKYKDIKNAKQEYQQFKSDLKEHIDNSPSQVVQVTMQVVNLASQQSSTASAQLRMKEIDPEFNLWELEDDAKGIFIDAYHHYLEGNYSYLENLCADSALGYFRVLLKKQEAEKSVPKYKQLWNVDKAYFYTASLPENNMPVFVFTVQCQEIYCMISKIDGKIIDGDDERIMIYEFQFAITPNFEMDVEKVGHNWQIIELIPRQITLMLV